MAAKDSQMLLCTFPQCQESLMAEQRLASVRVQVQSPPHKILKKIHNKTKTSSTVTSQPKVPQISRLDISNFLTENIKVMLEASSSMIDNSQKD